ncbi:MAG: VOC family protein [Anaerolineaceae bacterium]
MTTDLLPAGWHTVTPRIVTRDVDGLVEFLRHVFGAVGDCQVERPSEIRMGDSIIMVSGAAERDPMPAFLYVYVGDVDVTYRLALEAGAVSVEAPQDTPYGDQRAMVTDSWGNIWQIATRK